MSVSLLVGLVEARLKKQFLVIDVFNEEKEKKENQGHSRSRKQTNPIGLSSLG